MIHLPDPPPQRAVGAVVALQLLLLSAAAGLVAVLAWALAPAGLSPLALLIFQPAYVVVDGAPRLIHAAALPTPDLLSWHGRQLRQACRRSRFNLPTGLDVFVDGAPRLISY
jgi:hypothetical protein